MTKLKYKLLILLAFCVVFADSARAQLQPPISQRLQRQQNVEPQRPSGMISAGQARKMAEEKFGGKALSTTFVQAGDNSAYRVKLIKGGRVRIVTIPAKP
ncbi:MAG: PepSY domain-containing protein [Proteobacteria bacterium]|jgi:uncharacterized membrane protein YkoI|nr:PepSY domain-containing protein [Pseudomonadota bacterium]